MIIADKQIIKERFTRNFDSYHRSAVVQKKVVARFCEILQAQGFYNFNRILEVGCGTGFLTHQFLNHYQPKHFFLNDLSANLYGGIAMDLLQKEITNYTYLPGDAEQINFPEHLDAIISTSTVQWFQHLEKFIQKVNCHLSDNGIFAFSTFGEYNFMEIKQLLDLGLCYYSIEKLQELLTPDFEILHMETWHEILWFNHPMEVLKHIKATGVNGLKNFTWNKTKLQIFATSYRNLFTNAGKVRLTYHPMLIIAKKKHA